MGYLRKRGRVWWLRYYVDGKRVEESTRTDDRTKAAEILKLREHARRAIDRPHCKHCGELPIGPRSFQIAWLRRIEKRYNGRLPSIATLEMLHEQQVWARLRKQTG